MWRCLFQEGITIFLLINLQIYIATSFPILSKLLENYTIQSKYIILTEQYSCKLFMINV